MGEEIPEWCRDLVNPVWFGKRVRGEDGASGKRAGMSGLLYLH